MSRCWVVALCLATLVSANALRLAVDEIGALEDSAFVDEGKTTCHTEIRSAKVACGEKLAMYKKMQASKCMEKEMSAVMSRIKRNHARTKTQQSALKRAEDALRKQKYKGHGVAKTFAGARENLVKALVTQIHQKNAMKSDTQKALDELKDEKSTRYKANKATNKAVKLAETSRSMQPVHLQAGKAKALWAKMVEEKVKVGRAKFLNTKDKKQGTVTKAMIKKLYATAKRLWRKEQKDQQRVKDAIVKVARENVKLTQDETKTAKLDKDASKKEEKQFKKKALKQKRVVKRDQAKLKAAKKKLDAANKDATSAKHEVSKVKGMDLKALLAQASNLLKP